MINASTQFKTALANNDRRYVYRASILLTDDTTITVDATQILMGGFTVEDSVSSNSGFGALGATIINAATLLLNNNRNQFEQYDFENALVSVYVGKVFTDTEWIQKGVYIVDRAEKAGAAIRLSLLDKMAYFDKPYSESTLVYPATLAEIVQDMCLDLNVRLDTFESTVKSTITIPTKPNTDSLTYRQLLGWVAELAGCFARFNNVGDLQLKWFSDTFDYTVAGVFTRTISQYPVTITKVKITIDNPSTEDDASRTLEYTAGTSDDYIINITNNSLITTSNAQTIANHLFSVLSALGTFYAVNLTHASNPLMEAGDRAKVLDRANQQIPFYVTSTTFVGGNKQSTSCSAETPTKNGVARYTASDRAEVKVSEILNRKLPALEEKMKNELGGLYYTEVPTSSGTVVYYHNKPELEDSDIQIVISDVGITVTDNGGESWYGLEVNGDLITNIISATGLNADWIRTGILQLGKYSAEDVELGDAIFEDWSLGSRYISGNHAMTVGDVYVLCFTDTDGIEHKYLSTATQYTRTTSANPASSIVFVMPEYHTNEEVVNHPAVYFDSFYYGAEGRTAHTGTKYQNSGQIPVDSNGFSLYEAVTYSSGGKIEVYDVYNTRIGYWDATGLHLSKGVIESQYSDGTSAFKLDLDNRSITWDLSNSSLDAQGNLILSRLLESGGFAGGTFKLIADTGERPSGTLGGEFGEYTNDIDQTGLVSEFASNEDTTNRYGKYLNDGIVLYSKLDSSGAESNKSISSEYETEIYYANYSNHNSYAKRTVDLENFAAGTGGVNWERKVNGVSTYSFAMLKSLMQLNGISWLDYIDPAGSYDVAGIGSALDNKLDTYTSTLTGIDLDNQLTAGFFYCTNCTHIPSATNVTVSSTGYLWVFLQGTSIRQVWKDEIESSSVGYNEFEREYDGTTWTNWKRLAAKSVQIPNVVATATGASANNVEDALSGLASNKAPLASPALTGNPTAPTQTEGNNSTRLATTAFVQTALNNRLGALGDIEFHYFGSSSGATWNLDFGTDQPMFLLVCTVAGTNAASRTNVYVCSFASASFGYFKLAGIGTEPTISATAASNKHQLTITAPYAYYRAGIVRFT